MDKKRSTEAKKGYLGNILMKYWWETGNSTNQGQRNLIQTRGNGEEVTAHGIQIPARFLKYVTPRIPGEKLRETRENKRRYEHKESRGKSGIYPYTLVYSSCTSESNPE